MKINLKPINEVIKVCISTQMLTLFSLSRFEHFVLHYRATMADTPRAKAQQTIDYNWGLPKQIPCFLFFVFN